MRNRAWVGLLLALVLLSCAGTGAAKPPAVEINLPHIFEGEINKRHNPVGFHSRPGGRNPSGARVVEITDGPNRCGVYVAKVEIRSGDRWLPKRSTFFPDRMSKAEVIRVITEVYQESPKKEKFRGPSSECFTVEGYYQRGRVNTAWPIFVADRSETR